MKKIFSSIILIFKFPINLLKKTKIDNFVGGLIFGAIFSLFVNITTVQIQEVVQKQRILEAVENEIVNNYLQSIHTAKQNAKDIEENTPYNPFSSVFYKYSRDIWEQSSEPLQYIAQLEQDIQIAVSGYYTVVIPSQNAMLEVIDEITRSKLVNCSIINNSQSATNNIHCKQWNETRLDLEKSVALDISEQSFSLLKKFHPTKNRLDNWFLRTLMGNKSMRILSGE